MTPGAVLVSIRCGCAFADVGRAGGRIARVADSQMAVQQAQVLLVEDLRHQAHSLAYAIGRLAVAGGGDACALLAAMLQGIPGAKKAMRHIRIAAWMPNTPQAS